MNAEQLASALRNAFTAQGDWNLMFLRLQGPDFWRSWIEARLRGSDPWVPYARDEYPDLAADVFVRFLDAVRSIRFDLAACRMGASEFLLSLDWAPASAEHADVLRNALYLFGKFRSREPGGLKLLRELIAGERLLARSEWPIELHRSALYALAAAQARGDSTDADIWKKWLQPWQAGPPAHRYTFVSAAFAGLALSRHAVPAPELCGLLDLYREAKAASTPFRLAPAILAVWVERESHSTQVRAELWAAVKGRTTAHADWDLIRLCAEKAWPCVRPWPEMERLAAPLRPLLDRVPSLWAREVRLAM